MLASSGALPRCDSLPVALSTAKLATVKGSLRSAAYRKRRSGLSAKGILVGDGLSVPGIATLSINSSSPLARFIDRV
jgi:hypothetical protein